MKNKYEHMDAEQLHSEFKKLNRHLIAPNIVIAIIALIACITQLFLPFFKVSVTLNSDVVASVVDTIYEDYEDDEALIESDNTVITTLLTKNNIKEMTASLKCKLSVSFSASDLLSLAFASDSTVEDEVVSLLANMIDKMNILDEIETALNDMMPTVISAAVTATITSLTEDLDLDETQTEAINNCATAIESSVQKLADADTVDEELKTEVKSDVTASVSDTMTQLGYTQEDIDSISEQIDTYFDAFIDSAVDEEGTFSYVTLVSNMDTLIEALTDSTSSDGEESGLTDAEKAVILMVITDAEYEEILATLSDEEKEAMTEEELEDYVCNYYVEHFNTSTDSGSTDSGSSEDGENEGLTDAEKAVILMTMTEAQYAEALATLTAEERASMTEEELEDYVCNYYVENFSTSSYSGLSGTTTVKYILTDDSGTTGTTEEDNTSSTISYYISLLDDSNALVLEFLGEDLDHSTLQMIKTISMGLLVFVAVISALWAILALLALLHILLHNKKVGMWYVKLFGGLVAIIFYLIPALAILFASSAVASLASTLGMAAYANVLKTALGAISFSGSSGLIVIICLAVLWLVSIFWCHPIKKRIKRCKKALKRAENY